MAMSGDFEREFKRMLAAVAAQATELDAPLVSDGLDK
jgi:hypothetical protein